MITTLRVRIHGDCPAEGVSIACAGFTLVEVIVVLVLLSMAAAAVGPGLLTPARASRAELATVIADARRLAVRRASPVWLRVDVAGFWRIAAEPARSGPLMSGRLDSVPGAPFDVLFSPLGTCAADLELAPRVRSAELDPLTCELSGS